MNIELRLMRCGLALAEHSNFARAAKAVHMSQPSLSRNIQELERRLGVQLFSRNQNQRGVEPTEAGELFLEQAREVVSRANDLVREMDLVRGMQKGDLSIGVGLYSGPAFVDKALGRLIRDHPAARLFLAYQSGYDLLPRVLSRELDFAVMYMPEREYLSQFHLTKLKPHSLYFVTRSGHPLLRQRRKLTLADASQYPLSTASRIPPFYLKWLRAGYPKHSFNTKSFPSVRCESVAMMKSIVAESDAVGIFPINTVLPELENKTMAILPLATPLGSTSIVRLQHRSLSPLGEKLVQLITVADSEAADFEQQFTSRKGRPRE